MPFARVLVLFLLTHAETQCDMDSDDSVCLLSLKSERHRPRRVPTSTKEVLASWKESHAKTRADARDSRLNLDNVEVDIDAFISQQDSASHACHAKMLEDKRTIDGLLSRVEAISDEIESNTEIIETQTDEMHERKAEKVAAEAAHQLGLAECEKAKTAGQAEVKKYDAEIEELTQIADPDVRSSIAEDVALLQKSNIDSLKKQLATVVVTANTTACRKLTRKLRAQNPDTDVNGRSCDGKREELQEEFTKSFTELVDMRDNQQEEIDESHKDCVSQADEKLEEDKMRADSAINGNTKHIERSQDTITDLDPLLQDAKRSLAKVQLHVDHIKSECTSEEDVSVHIKKIRDLISSLENCPGRHDFTLKTPKVDIA